MSLIASTALYLLADYAYLYYKGKASLDEYGRLGRATEALGITVVVAIWGWWAAPQVFNSELSGMGGFFIYGVLFVVCSLILLYFGHYLFAPIGVGAALSTIVVALGTLVTMGVVSSSSEEIPAFVGPFFVAATVGCQFVGAYLVSALYAFAETDTEEPDPVPAELPAPDSSDQSATPSLQTGNLETHHPAESASHNRSASPVGASDHRLSSAALDQYSYDWQYSNTEFADIGGYYEIKSELDSKVIEPIRSAGADDDRFSRFGIEPARGIMFYGPPGTGKTMFARALAGELSAPFLELSPGDVTSRWINASSEQIKALFDEADSIGRCVIFLDEAEHLFGARDVSDLSSHVEDRKVTSEFLAQLSREGREAIVVSATNRPGDIDPAILRPGRLATHFEIDLPDEETRHAILEIHLAGVPSSLSGEELAALGAQNRGLTGAELEELVLEARRNAATRDAETITREDFPPGERLAEESESNQSQTSSLPNFGDQSRGYQ
ncbi:AAA family ATPase [Halosimplex halobium]|uniref:AAA family ATPase n=1 Tax=Halosimplex halobium TaxID=3396618 RepID=UPI003F5673CD